MTVFVTTVARHLGGTECPHLNLNQKGAAIISLFREWCKYRRDAAGVLRAASSSAAQANDRDLRSGERRSGAFASPCSYRIARFSALIFFHFSISSARPSGV